MTPEEREARAARIAGARITHQLCSAMECELAALVSELDRVTLAFENARQAAAANHLAKCDALESLARVTAERDLAHGAMIVEVAGDLVRGSSRLREERDAAIAERDLWRATHDALLAASDERSAKDRAERDAASALVAELEENRRLLKLQVEAQGQNILVALAQVEKLREAVQILGQAIISAAIDAGDVEPVPWEPKR